jgi:hypothetical protein
MNTTAPLARTLSIAAAAVVIATVASPPALARGGGGHVAAGGGWHGGAGYVRAGHWGHRGGYWPRAFWGGVGVGVGIGAIGHYGGYYAPYYAPYYGPYYRGYYYDAPVVVAPGYPTAQAGALPPTGQPVPQASAAADPIFYPKNGQSAEATESDRRECNRWATTQRGAMADASIFQRATLACMEGRGYTVK